MSSTVAISSQKQWITTSENNFFPVGKRKPKKRVFQDSDLNFDIVGGKKQRPVSNTLWDSWNLMKSDQNFKLPLIAQSVKKDSCCITSHANLAISMDVPFNWDLVTSRFQKRNK